MTPWTAACQAFVSFTILQSLLKFMSIESMMSSNPLFFCCPLLLLPSILPSIRVFSKVLGRQLHRGVSSPAYRKKRKGQSALLEPVIFQVPSMQNNQYSKATHFRLTFPELLQRATPVSIWGKPSMSVTVTERR